MSTVTVRLNSEESELFNSYAELHDIPLSTLFKETLIEKMEDDLDLKLIKEYEKAQSEKDRDKNILGGMISCQRERSSSSQYFPC